MSFSMQPEHTVHSGICRAGGGGTGTPYNGLYGEAPPERGVFFRLEVHKRVGIPRDEV